MNQSSSHHASCPRAPPEDQPHPTYTPGPALTSSKAVSTLSHLMGSPTWHQNFQSDSPSRGPALPIMTRIAVGAKHLSQSGWGPTPDNCSSCCQDSQLAGLVANHTYQCIHSNCGLTATGGHMQPTQGTPLEHLALGSRELPHQATQDTFCIRQCFQDWEM